MTSSQIELVQASFQMIQPVAPDVARMFYSRLFEIDPALRPMFRGDLEEQGRKLMQMLGYAVGALRRLDQIVPAVEDLGRRHAHYGVRDEDYTKVAEALLWTLTKCLGASFTAEMCEAWIAVYGAMTAAMKRGASAVATAA
ncbi:MAG: hemin receptor [Acidobacteriia bacterium]|nr:hemin receptor [Terriglobia bacterium]